MGPLEDDGGRQPDRGARPAGLRYEPVPARYQVESDRQLAAGRSLADVYDPRLEKGVWFVIGLLCSLIGIRFLMKLFGASYQADFVRFVYGVTGVLIAPFRGIFQATGSGNFILEPESLIAIAIYILIGWAAVSLIRIIRTPRTQSTGH